MSEQQYSKSDAPESNPESLGDWAICYAERGWPVFPVAPRDKLPLVRRIHEKGDRCHGECGKMGHGFYDAVTDPYVVEQWWERWPDANIGLATGHAFDVIDLDVHLEDRVDGIAEFDHLVVAHPEAPWPDLSTFPVVHTGGGGMQMYVTITGRGNGAKFHYPHCPCETVEGNLGPHGQPREKNDFHGIDYRGKGGYVVAPPSIHPSGQPYQWIDVHEYPTPGIPPAWWLQETMGAAPKTRGPSPLGAICLGVTVSGATDAYGAKALEGILSDLAAVAEGGRNHALNSAAYRAFRIVAGGHLSENEAEARLEEVAIAIGLSEHETMATINSAKAGLARPAVPATASYATGTRTSARAPAIPDDATVRAARAWMAQRKAAQA